MRGGTVIIDDAANGGSDPGAWLTHIAHTPALRAQCPEEFPARTPSGRAAAERADGEAGETIPSANPASPASPSLPSIFDDMFFAALLMPGWVRG